MKSLIFPLNFMKLSEAEATTCREIVRHTEGLMARHVNKRFSLPLSIYLSRAGISPNQITFFNLLVGLLAGWVASRGGYLYLLMAAVLFQAVSILDGCDGEVAKLKVKCTKFGAWFDTIGDNLSFVVFITGVTFGLYRETHAIWIVHLAKLALANFAVLLSIMISYLLKQKSEHASLVTYEKEVVSRKAERQNPLVARAAHYGKFLVKKDFFSFLFFFLAVIDKPQAIVFFAALGSTAVALVLGIMTIRGWRSPKAIQEGTGQSVTGVVP
ncbi:MAG TPA: hypothetical protein DF383_13470 [Deltaproteobacteria bacterium]|nr:hypothetical protein [Deltaproteobacteria bacterium]